MINTVCSHAYKSAGTLLEYLYRTPINAFNTSFYTVAAAVTLPFRALGWCQSEICGGSNQSLRENLDESFRALTLVTADSILHIINPDCQIKHTSGYRGDDALNFLFKNTITMVANSTYFFNREITTRLCFALMIPAVVVARVYDAVVGTVALTAAALLLATNSDLNGIAFSHVNSLGYLVGDLFDFALGILNPKALVIIYD